VKRKKKKSIDTDRDQSHQYIQCDAMRQVCFCCVYSRFDFYIYN